MRLGFDSLHDLLTAYSRDQMRVYIKAYRRRLLDSAADSLGGICVGCGAREDLQFDHTDPKTVSFRIADGWNKPRSLFWTEVAKCQLLCQPCHTLKTAREQGWTLGRGTHGTRSAYRYCGPPACPECKAANAAYERGRNRLQAQQKT